MTLSIKQLCIFLITFHCSISSMTSNTTSITQNSYSLTPRIVINNQDRPVHSTIAPSSYARLTRQEKRAQSTSIQAISLDNRITKISDAINEYLLSREELGYISSMAAFFIHRDILDKKTIKKPEEKLAALTSYVEFSSFSPTVIEKLKNKNSYFNACLQQTIASKTALLDSEKITTICPTDYHNDLPLDIKRYINNQLIKHYEKSLTHRNGFFTPNLLRFFLAQELYEKRLINKNFKNACDLTVEKLTHHGGYNTVQIFLVTATHNNTQESHYIIKESREGINEKKQLQELNKLTILHDIVIPRAKKGLPSIVLPHNYCEYRVNKKIHYLSIIPLAPGKPLRDLIIQFRDTQNESNKQLLSRAFLTLGRETANFHKLRCTPHKEKVIKNAMIHGDFHLLHIFFDEIADHCTFIDNASIARSIHTYTSPAVDIIKLFFMPFSTNRTYQQFRDLIKGIHLEIWHDITIKNFATGYTNTYSTAESIKALEEIKKIFNDPFTIPWVDFYDEELEEIRKKYINPLFDTLIKENRNKVIN
jgi:hypothetical protein